MQLVQAFRLQPKEVVAFVGGGGKTSTLFRLAEELVAQGKRVITTTTTHMLTTQIHRAPLVVRYDAAFDLGARILDGLDAKSHVLVVGADTEAGRTLGVPASLVDELAALEPVDAILVEADGARMRPFKAPAEHEPVVPATTTLQIPVIGVPALGAPLDDTHVHRADIAARLAGAHRGEMITPNIAARVLAHHEGGLKHKPSDARALALINQIETDTELEAARTLARLLLGYGAIEAVALGAVQRADPVCETHRRVALVILAAGGGTRMEGRIKPLLPWHGKTLIQNAIDLAVKTAAQQIIVVLGAYAEEIRATIADAPVQIVVNPDWSSGHASSIRAGLRAVSPFVDAVLFLNADQPLLTSAVLERILQSYYETAARIVVPFYAGLRGSPVLFARAYFDELMGLTGEQGGRALLHAHPDDIARVEFDSAHYGFDVDTPDEYALLLRHG